MPDSSGSRILRLFRVRPLAAALVIALLAAVGAPIAAPPPPVAATGAPKAVIIVGPASGSTSTFLSIGSALADQAAAAGMDVRRVFHPKATPERVLQQIQGAKYVVYLGHGNGWPSPYGPFQEKTKNGFGLNAYEGASAYDTAYRGGNWVRANVKLAQNAVVVLIGACYTTGNGESGMAIPTWDVARQRVDNYATAFLTVGAGAVYAFGRQQKVNIPRELMTSNKTFDAIFRVPDGGSLAGFIGTNNKYFTSERTAGTRNHLDRHSSVGFKRAVSGWLDRTAADWRAGTSTSDSGSSTSTSTTTTVSTPTGLAAQSLGYRYVKLTWNASTSSNGSAIRYRIFRNGTRIATVKTLYFTDRPAYAGSYNYKVRAIDAYGYKSPFSEVVVGKAIKGPL